MSETVAADGTFDTSDTGGSTVAPVASVAPLVVEEGRAFRSDEETRALVNAAYGVADADPYENPNPEPQVGAPAEPSAEPEAQVEVEAEVTEDAVEGEPEVVEAEQVEDAPEPEPEAVEEVVEEVEAEEVPAAEEAPAPKKRTSRSKAKA